MKLPLIVQKLNTFEKENDMRFTPAKFWLLHTGLNLNNSRFQKEVVEAALPTLSNTPILAHFNVDPSIPKDFGGHEVETILEEDGTIKRVHHTIAIGVIPESNNAKWEMRVTDSGELLEYLTVEGLIWNKWDDTIEILQRKGGVTSQSMEITDVEATRLADNSIHIESFKFFGAALLGDKHQSAMINSTAELQFSEDAIVSESKLQEFYSLLKEGGENVSVEDKKEFVEVEETEEITAETVEEVVENTVEEVETTETNEENKEEFEEEQVEETVTIQDTDIEEADAEDKVEPEEAEEDLDFRALLDQETQAHSDTRVQLENLQSKYEELNGQFTILTQQIRKRELEDVKAKFAGRLSEDKIQEVFETMADADIQTIEDKIFAEIGKLSVELNFSQEEKMTGSKVPVLEVQQNESPYGRFVSKK